MEKNGQYILRYGVNRAKRDGVNILRNSHYDEFVAINQSFRVNKGLDEGQ